MRLRGDGLCGFAVADFVRPRGDRLCGFAVTDWLLRGVKLCVRRVKVFDLQQVKLLSGIWVAPAGSYRSDVGRKRNRRSLRDTWVALAIQRADRP
jgi:hypothetical protein